MICAAGSGSVGAEPLRDYFDLQLRFAETMVDRAGRPLDEVVARYTNLHRRFGLGILRGVPTSPLWHRYVQGLLEASSHQQRLDWTMVCYRQCPAEPPPSGQQVFGCFGCDRPNDDGEVRLHFVNRDRDGVSPLASEKQERRRGELRAMFSFVCETHPQALSVRGTSWLYHLEAYRRLFPADYAASRRAPERPLQFHGSSSWGQFLDHRGRVKAQPRAVFLENLEKLDPERPREAFPLPALAVSAPLATFYACYGVEMPLSRR